MSGRNNACPPMVAAALAQDYRSEPPHPSVVTGMAKNCAAVFVDT
jgi:hypothetical protein